MESNPDEMKYIKRILFAILILVGTLGVAAPLRHSIEGSAIPEPAQMLLVGIGLVILSGYGRRKLYKR